MNEHTINVLNAISLSLRAHAQELYEARNNEVTVRDVRNGLALSNALISLHDVVFHTSREIDVLIALNTEPESKTEPESESEPEARTLGGKVLTDADFEALAEEAERGYEVPQAPARNEEETQWPVFSSLADALTHYMGVLSPTAIASIAGLSEGTIRKILSGQTKTPHGKTLAKIEKALGLDSGDLDVF
jgi:hypothetical protein